MAIFEKKVNPNFPSSKVGTDVFIWDRFSGRRYNLMGEGDEEWGEEMIARIRPMGYDMFRWRGNKLYARKSRWET